MSDEPPVPFFDLPEQMFPIHAEAISEKTGDVVWECTIDGPGAFEIPTDLSATYGSMAVRVTTGDGGVTYMASDGTQA